jgi:uracil-DNA glycosylase
MNDTDELCRLTSSLRRHIQKRPGLVVPPEPRPAAPNLNVLHEIRAELGDCTRCKLHPTRKNIVFGVGNPSADLVFVGEAPGANEDAQGEPFVGDAGQLLTKMINAMGWRREDVYIANILKCRPPGNRNPEADEIEECEPFLIKQLAAIEPRVIVALGKFAAQCLLRKPDTPISALRGRFHEYQGIPVMPTYHPAYLLRTPSAKRTVWDDLQLVMRELERLGVVPSASS